MRRLFVTLAVICTVAAIGLVGMGCGFEFKEATSEIGGCVQDDVPDAMNNCFICRSGFFCADCLSNCMLCPGCTQYCVTGGCVLCGMCISELPNIEVEPETPEN